MEFLKQYASNNPLKSLLIIIFSALFLFLIIYPYRYKIQEKIKLVLHKEKGVGRGSKSCPKCHILFTDNVATQAQAYYEEGITPQKDFKGLKQLLKSGKLVQLTSNKFYNVRKARYSRPYVMPKAYKFIQQLSKKYKKQCEIENIKYVPYTISSVTRSEQSIEDLRRTNANAIENSAHLKGKTFDISWRALSTHKTQTKVFIRVLAQLNRTKNCFVKFENNGCLHITVI